MATKKKTARRVKAAPSIAEPQEKPDLVLVRAKEKGYYGEILRNEGEVFAMDTKYMEPVAKSDEIKAIEEDMTTRERLDRQKRIDSYDVIESEGGATVLLPSWVELVEDGDAVSEPAGHPKVASPTNKDVL